MESSEIINIIRLDGIHTPSPTFSPGFNHAYTEYRSTPSDTDIIIERIKDADVVITTRIPISDETLERCPKLKHVAVLAIGLRPCLPRFSGPQSTLHPTISSPQSL
jgi:glycerate dehydrogenase